MEARARDGLWSIRRRNVSTPPSPIRSTVLSTFFFFLNFWVGHICFPSAIVKGPPSLLFLYFFFVCLFQLSISFSSAADEISGETVAIKMVTRIFAKTTLAKRALRELTLLRHFSNHENITGLIDVDCIAESFNEV